MAVRSHSVDAQCPGPEQRGSFAPGRQRDRIDAGARLLGHYREILAQIQPGPQFVDGLLPRAHGLGGSAGASSQRASVSSPMWVRAVQSSSKSEPLPNRSRSCA